MIWDCFSLQEKGDKLSEKHLPNPFPALVKKCYPSSLLRGESCQVRALGDLYTLNIFPEQLQLFSLPVWLTSASRCTETGLHGLKKIEIKNMSELLCHLVMESMSGSVLRIKGSATHLHHSLPCKELNLFLFIYLCISFLQTQNKNRNSPGRLHLPASTSFIQYYSLSLFLCSWIIMTPLKQWFLPPATSWQL